MKDILTKIMVILAIIALFIVVIIGTDGIGTKIKGKGTDTNTKIEQINPSF